MGNNDKKFIFLALSLPTEMWANGWLKQRSADQAVGLTDKETEMSIDRRLNTEKITSELINYIVEKLVREIQPEKIILFGSYARGDFDRDSDLDLFIIKDAKESSRIMRRRIESLLRGRKFAVDLLVRKPKEVEWNFKAQNPFYLYHIFRDGKVLYKKS